jgi:eukaryotic-like serine/threonine-protein kinase
MQGTMPPVLAGRYVLEEEAGSGGMASVWRATDEVLSRPVAVKLLHTHLAQDPGFRARFEREALSAARLTHPNIVNVFDTGEEGGTSYIVMEYLDGGTLADFEATEGPIDPARAIDIVLQILLALSAAHGAGIIHRDVKPANILIGPDGRVKVADFGIAKAAYMSGADVTTTGTVLGSIPYLSPEQVTGQELDARSDLFAVGVVLYELLSGRRPFEAETDLAAAMMRLTADPMPPRAIRPGIPRGLEAVTMKALARRPGDRFASAEEMAAALSRFRREPSGAPPPAGTSPAPSGQGGQSFFRAWMLVPLLLVVAGAAAITVGLILGRLEFGGPLLIQPVDRDGGASEPESGPRDPALPFTSAADLDPFGTGAPGEHSEEVPLAHDGDAETYWSSEDYESLDLGAKPGVGLLFDLGAGREVSGFRLLTPFPGFAFQVRVGDDPDALVNAAGPAYVARASMREEIAPPLTGRYVLVWITSVVETAEGNRAAVAEFRVFGPRV